MDTSLVSEMTHYVSRGTYNPYLLTQLYSKGKQQQ